MAGHPRSRAMSIPTKSLLNHRAAGFDDFFEKPTDIKILLKAAQDPFEKLERWEMNESDLVWDPNGHYLSAGPFGH